MKSKNNHSHFGSPLRYPGGKGKLSSYIKLLLAHNSLTSGQYIELYAGGAAIAWSLLFDEYVEIVHINDIDSSLYAFWRSLLEKPDEFCKLIQDTKISMKEWHRQKLIQQNPSGYSRLERGFSTFFLNRTNRSGILTGGVIGGKEQNGKWKLDARFNKSNLIKRIERIANYKERIFLYNLDASKFINEVLPDLPQNAFVFLDPPYYVKGKGLYENHYSEDDHAVISDLVTKSIGQPWVVTYDNVLEIRDLYVESPLVEYNINYSAQDRYAGSEVMFFSKSLKIPKVEDPAKIKSKHLEKFLL